MDVRVCIDLAKSLEASLQGREILCIVGEKEAAIL